jgi:hypothetical protein
MIIRLLYSLLVAIGFLHHRLQSSHVAPLTSERQFADSYSMDELFV